jgi:hypothetical protein
MICSRCEATVQFGRGEFHMLDVFVVADTSPPVFLEEDISIDPEREIEILLNQLRAFSAELSSAKLNTRRGFLLCNACYTVWSDDPFGDRRKT